MSRTTTCWQCGRKLLVPDGARGVRCPQCGTTVKAPPPVPAVAFTPPPVRTPRPPEPPPEEPPPGDEFTEAAWDAAPPPPRGTSSDVPLNGPAEPPPPPEAPSAGEGDAGYVPLPLPTDRPARRAPPMATVGVGLMTIGFCMALFFWLLFDTGVGTPAGTVHNIGKLVQQLCGVMVSLALAVVGCLLFLAGRIIDRLG